MKKTFLATLQGTLVLAMTLLSSTTFTACSSDDEPSIPAPQTFSGTLTTTIPDMPSFEAIEGENSCIITWDNPEQTSATVRMGAFDIAMSTPMGERSYEIGEMVIAGVTCVNSGNIITLTKENFECQAGDFLTTGSLTGELKNGILTLTLLYKPGSMPFDVQSVLVGKQ